ncbi:MAG TPA: erythromycin esterase family protein [Mycobacteriales bacterium]|nr:erythromycin esterase family protein [Mycobacteriales bacterium]
MANARITTSTADDAHSDPEVTAWLARMAQPLHTIEVDASLADLEPLRAIVGDAVIVGIGGSTYGAHEQFTLTTRIIRFLVEELGFRTVATEEDWDVALDLDQYVVTGAGNLSKLMSGTNAPWRVREIHAALEWLRGYNAGRADPVRFVGVGVIDTRPAVYDLVEVHVGRVAPDRLAELREHFAVIRPVRPDHVRWFFAEVADKDAFVEHARQALRLVENLPSAGPDSALAVQHARQIVAVYEHYVHHVVEDGYRDTAMADNLRWWQEYTGHRIAYWSTNAHSARSTGLTVSIPPKGRLEFTPTGERLRERYGDRYVSLGLTFDHGTVISGWGLPPFARRPLAAPSVPAQFAERPLCDVDLDQFLVDLRTPVSGHVGRWLDGPARTRVIGSICDPGQPPEEYWMAGGSLRQWFDVLLHSNRPVSPTADL